MSLQRLSGYVDHDHDHDGYDDHSDDNYDNALNRFVFWRFARHAGTAH
jgi:hypothetical protein